MNVLNRPDGLGAAANALAAVFAAALGNALVFGLGWTSDADAPIQPAFAPPGWVVGVVWLVLFACMGTARWKARVIGPAGRRAERRILLLLVLCWSYPIYTLGLRLYPGMVGNLACLLASVWVTRKVWPASPVAGGLLLPVIAWIAFACALTSATVALNWPGGTV